MKMQVEITSERFDPWQAIARYQESALGAGKFGATAVFVGTMRDSNDGDAVRYMVLEHYPDMTSSHLREICEQAHRRWELQNSLVIHRVGKVVPGDAIVLVAVWSAHRADAYAANRFIMEDLKSKAPFWKKETLAEGTRWVERNTPG